MTNITFCTSWYNVKSKFDITIYQKWMSNIIQHVNNFNLIIYTNKESYYVLQPLIKENKKIKVVFKEWDEFYGFKWKDEWSKNHENNDSLNDKSRYNTDWKLNMLWSEKIHFVKEAAEKQYFDTDFYGWCDIGYFRNSTVANWPSPDKIDELESNKIYYGRVGSKSSINHLMRIILTKNEQNMPSEPIPIHQVSCAGGFFISHKTKLEWWHTTYYNRLDEYFINDYLVKDDQMIVIDCIMNNLIKFKMVEESDPYKDKWFVFQSYLK